jgi:hydrogenase-4 component E
MDPLISHHAAGEIIDAASIALIVTAFLGTISRRVDTSILLLALQGVFLCVATAGAALAEDGYHAWFALLLALAVKVVVIPRFAWSGGYRRGYGDTVANLFSVKLTFPIAAALIPFAYFVVDPLNNAETTGFDAPNAIPAALALVLLGLFTMLIRKAVIIHLLSLITMENGLYLAAIAATRGLPFAVELGIALDAVAAVGITLLVITEIVQLHGRAGDVDRLSAQRG